MECQQRDRRIGIVKILRLFDLVFHFFNNSPVFGGNVFPQWDLDQPGYFGIGRTGSVITLKPDNPIPIAERYEFVRELVSGYGIDIAGTIVERQELGRCLNFHGAVTAPARSAPYSSLISTTMICWPDVAGIGEKPSHAVQIAPGTQASRRFGNVRPLPT